MHTSCWMKTGHRRESEETEERDTEGIGVNRDGQGSYYISWYVSFRPQEKPNHSERKKENILSGLMPSGKQVATVRNTNSLQCLKGPVCKM